MQKNHRRLYIISILILIISITGCINIHRSSTLIVDDYNGVDLDRIHHYRIEVDFDPMDRSYTADQTVVYMNNTGRALDEVYFHIYPNAYSNIETAPVLFDMANISREQYRTGYVWIEEIRVDGEKVDFTIEGEGNTILKIESRVPIESNGKANIDLKYRIGLPRNIDRFGYGDGVFNFGNWYPIACVYDDKGWNLDPYYSIGDPFYSDIGNYDITIRVPKDMVIAATGKIASRKARGDSWVYTIESKLTRDFAWAASPHFSIEELEIGGTTIKLYFMEDSSDMVDSDMVDFALQVGADSLEIFNRCFGKYPYSQYSIVLTEFPTGMEYPNMVFINKDYLNQDYKATLEQVIVHETAHQWWYGIVGNDQIDEAWLDEALTSYSEVIYMANKYGEPRAMDYYTYNFQIPYEQYSEYSIEDGAINKPLDQFENWKDYGFLVYIKGAVFINSIGEDFGTEVLYDILNRYYSIYRFRNGDTEGFLKVCQEVTGTSFEEEANRWLYDR
ncbi:MAG: M1 family metallopeptidase [Tissierellia bacterium]|nr:M1 family metallopeptidase [Tissierellia bacterium]